ncbi:MAG: heavy metal translocating P-type ATPase [Chloroflexi bacterium]|nr:heavy metal translocating P-type ATPase [Chloroflexota bacterium]MBP7042765.1 heavy metal translocating P-type ATPase [Chloroflexota bacterium]
MSEQTFQITGMDCADCARSIEKGVAKLDGVALCRLNFTTETLRVDGSVDQQTVVNRIRELGYNVAAPTAEQAAQPPAAFFPYLWQRRDTRLALLATLLILPGLLFHELLPGAGISGVWIDLTAVLAMIIAGLPIFKSAWTAVRVNREININVLMSIAAIGAVLIGAYTEAGMVMVLFVIAEAIEGYATARARQSIRSLMELAPGKATVLRFCVDCASHLGQDGYDGGPCPICGLEEQRVPVADLRLGETIIVKPGERVPMDGRLLSGSSAVNQAPITGESVPVEKQPGDDLFAGSINGQGTLEIEVTHLAEDNTISRLIRLVAEAQESQAPTQRFVDQFAKYYTPAVVAIAALVAIVPPLFFNQPLVAAADPAQGWLYRALALLVVACPCALVISTPVSIVSAISNGARHGVIFKGGAHLEELSRVRAIAFDKTGTLTLGSPAVVAVRSVECRRPADADCADCDDLLALACAVEQRSEHPIAQAVVEAAAQRSLDRQYAAAEDVRALMGRGVTGQVNGRVVTIGSHVFFADHLAHAAHCAELETAANQGYTTMLVRRDDAYLGYIAVADTMRPSGETAVAELRALGIDHLIMLTGDNEQIAHKVAADVGVTEVQANCLPEDKVTAVTKLRQQYGHVVMVGDGINDAPALAAANVGIAIGHTAQALETADITLMRDDLRLLPFAVRLSRATMRIIGVNVALALGLKFAFFVLVLLGLGSMWLAVLADMGVSLLVTLNGMRLLRRPRMEEVE